MQLARARELLVCLDKPRIQGARASACVPVGGRVQLAQVKSCTSTTLLTAAYRDGRRVCKANEAQKHKHVPGCDPASHTGRMLCLVQLACCLPYEFPSTRDASTVTRVAGAPGYSQVLASARRSFVPRDGGTSSGLWGHEAGRAQVRWRPGQARSSTTALAAAPRRSALAAVSQLRLAR